MGISLKPYLWTPYLLAASVSLISENSKGGNKLLIGRITRMVYFGYSKKFGFVYRALLLQMGFQPRE